MDDTRFRTKFLFKYLERLPIALTFTLSSTLANSATCDRWRLSNRAFDVAYGSEIDKDVHGTLLLRRRNSEWLQNVRDPFIVFILTDAAKPCHSWRNLYKCINFRFADFIKTNTTDFVSLHCPQIVEWGFLNEKFFELMNGSRLTNVRALEEWDTYQVSYHTSFFWQIWIQFAESVRRKRTVF